MTRLRKIALIGIASATVLMVVALIADFPAVVGGVHALPFIVLLMYDISTQRDRARQQEREDKK